MACDGPGGGSPENRGSRIRPRGEIQVGRASDPRRRSHERSGSVASDNAPGSEFARARAPGGQPSLRPWKARTGVGPTDSASLGSERFSIFRARVGCQLRRGALAPDVGGDRPEARLGGAVLFCDRDRRPCSDPGKEKAASTCEERGRSARPSQIAESTTQNQRARSPPRHRARGPRGNVHRERLGKGRERPGDGTDTHLDRAPGETKPG